MRHGRPHEAGGILLTTLTVTALAGTILASYLTLVQYQNRSVLRSQYWNSGIAAAEAGIEEGLTHLNAVGDGSRAANGWSLVTNTYQLKRGLADSRYEISISSASQPTITSSGYVTDPATGNEIKRTVLVTTTRYGAGMRGIVTRNGLTMNGNTKIDSFNSADPSWSTNRRYDSAKAHDYGYAAAVNGDLIIEGAGVWGYVATGPSGSVTGNVGDSSWMAGHSGIQPGRYANDLNLSFPDVTVPFNGGALTPPANQSVTVTNYTYLSTQIVSTTYPSPDPGGVSTSMQAVTTTTKPFSWSGTLVTNLATVSSTIFPFLGTYIGNVATNYTTSGHGSHQITVTNYQYQVISGYTYDTTAYTYNLVTTNASTSTSTYSLVSGTGNYQVNSLSLSGHDEYLVQGNTVLYLEGNFSMSGQSQITILPGASLTIYVGGSASLSGNGIVNLGADASKFSFYGLPTCTSISMSGNAAFTGTIYAPNADLSLNGGGNSTYDCVGAVVVNTAAFHGNFTFHYDENLGNIGGTAQYRIASWNEI